MNFLWGVFFSVTAGVFSILFMASTLGDELVLDYLMLAGVFLTLARTYEDE